MSVHAVAEPGILIFFASLARIASSTRSGGASWPDLDQQPHDVSVRAAVKRSLERADGGDDCGIEVGERRGSDAGRERRRVQLVIGVQDERDVERMRRQRVRTIAGQHVEEIRRVPERRVRLNRPAAQPACVRKSRRCCQAVRSGEPPFDSSLTASCRQPSGSY